MYDIGDKVVYPMQGVGVIERKENKVFAGKETEYIVIKILSNNMEIMIPSSKIDNSNIRMISNDSALQNILSSLPENSDTLSGLSNKERYETNLNKFKCGTLKDSAEVVYDLILMNKEKTLNTSEKKLYKTAHKFLVDEVSFIKNITTEEADSYLHLNLN